MPTQIKTLLIAVTLALFPTPTRAATPPDLTGTWLLASATLSHESRVESGWNSLLTISPDHTFTITNFMDTTQTYKGDFVLNPDKDPASVDLHTQPVDLSERWAGEKYAAATIHARYAFTDGTLSLSFNYVDNTRPANLTTEDRKTVNLSFRRAAPNFKSLPDKISLTVLDPAGQPVPNASIFNYIYIPYHPTFFPHPTAPLPAWQYDELTRTDSAGTAHIPTEKLQYYALGARDPSRNLVGLAAPAPADLQSPKVSITLAPQASLHGTLTADEFTRLNKKIEWTNVYLLYQGKRISSDDRSPAQFQFPVPPGDYCLDAYGTQLHSNFINITLPPNTPDFQLPPIPLNASRLALLQGKPVPELEGVLAWKNGPIKFADLKGKIVLVNFWGFWCGPCIHEMPSFLDLYAKYKDQGLAIITVHVDTDGDVDTVPKLEEKIAKTKADLWNNRDLPFPVALTSGKPIDTPTGEFQRGGAAAQFGILGYPTTLLINRQGILVGEFYLNPDPTAAAAQIQHLLQSDPQP